MRRLALIACLLALPGAAACGGDDTKDARNAAEGYVTTLGKRDGAGTCGRMTGALQRQFTDAVVRADARFKDGTCQQVMQAALDSISREQLAQFAKAKIDNLKLDGDRGTFTYTLGSIKVNGRVAKENGKWKVSCCVPGSG